MGFMRVLFFVLVIGLLIACHDSRKEQINGYCAENNSEQPICITSDYKETPNLISLNWIADTVFYLRLEHKMRKYVPGRSPYDLPCYMIYDKKDKTLGRLEQSLTSGFASHKFHFGFLNDYDSGLGFTPLCQSDNYLIMVNAGFSQGGFENKPKTLYEKGRIVNGEKYICRSDSFVNMNAQKKLKDFIKRFDEEQNTMLSIVKLKSL